MAEEQQEFADTVEKQPQELQIDDSLLGHQQEDADAPQFFIDESGKSLEFFIPAAEPQRELLINIIVRYGGKVSTNPDQGYYLSTLGEVHREVFDPRYIFDSEAKLGALSLSDYKILPPSGIYAANPNQSEVDAANTEAVERLVSYLDREQAEIQVQQPLQREASHTINRSVNQNAPAASDSVPQAKVGFTREEDDIILESVRRNPNRRSTHKLFEEIAKEIGRHTGNSVRYRFRKILVKDLDYVYKLDSRGNLILDADGNPIPTKEQGSTVKTKFTAKEDYELCKAIRQNLQDRGDLSPYTRDPKDVVLPGKFFETLAQNYPAHSKASWRDRYRKFALQHGIDKYVSYYEEEIKDGRVPEPIKNYTGKFLPSRRDKDDDLDEVVGETLREHNDQYNKRQQKKPNKRRKTAGNSNADASNLFISGGHDDLSEIGNSPGTFDSDAAAAVAAANHLGNPPNPPDPDDFLTEDLVSSKFFEFQPLISVVYRIQEIVGRDYQTSDAEALINSLYVETGIQKKFGTFIVTAVCGDLSLIPKFIEIFLKTGENPPQNIHGIWTPRDDQYLRSNDPDRLEYLRRLHGVKRIELRKDFINQDLV